jgi:hypothetical protein
MFKMLGALVVVALAITLGISEAELWYKNWSEHHRPPVEPRPHSYNQAPVLAKRLAKMQDSETSSHHYRDVTRRGNTWTVDDKAFTNEFEAAVYL